MGDKLDRILEIERQLISQGRDTATDRCVIDTLIEGLLHGEDIDIRERCASALRWVSDDSVTAPLVESISNLQEASFVREMAIEAVSYHNIDVAIPALLECLRDTSPEVRYWAIDVIGVSGFSDAIAALKDLAEHDSAVIDTGGSIADAATRAIATILESNEPD
ncbi:MAG TPA: HEAT repeat domain-containing protein [Capsulimonadaceae bacterium]|jgi:HEAT repeat protein